MNNEPVAWMLDYEISGIQGGEYRTNPFRHKNPRWDGNYEIREVTNAIPLYAHPVKEQLTDEEINKLWAESHEDGIAMQQGFTTQQHYFAHLILRKARE